MGIFKKKRKQPTKAELQSILASYKRQTAEITDETAMDMMDTEKKNDFLLLLKVADYAQMGKSRAILTAFKLGYMRGKAEHVPEMNSMEFQNIVSNAVLKIEKASTALRTTMEANLLNRTDLERNQIIAVGANASNICDMMIIADDYLYHAQKELEGILE